MMSRELVGLLPVIPCRVLRVHQVNAAKTRRCLRAGTYLLTQSNAHAIEELSLREDTFTRNASLTFPTEPKEKLSLHAKGNKYM